MWWIAEPDYVELYFITQFSYKRRLIQQLANFYKSITEEPKVFPDEVNRCLQNIKQISKFKII